MVIDFHAHTFPDKIAAAAVEKLMQASRTQAFSNGTMQGLRDSMARAGIDWSVALPVATNPVKAGSMNDLSIALTGHDGLIYFGCIHPDTPEWHAELGRIAAAGLKGVKIHPVYQNTDIDDVRFVRILARAGELGLTVVMHAGADIGFPGVVRCSPKQIAAALRQAGPVRLVAAHMGGWRNWDEACEYLADTDVLIDTAFSLGQIVPLTEADYSPEERLLLSEEAFCAMVRRFGSRRVLFGTDSPWADQRDSVAQIRALPLTDAEKDDIFFGNACRLLGIEKKD